MASESANGEKTKTTIWDSQEQTNEAKRPVISRKQIFFRFLYTILFLIILGIVIAIVEVMFVFQFIYLFCTQKPNESVRQFTNKLSMYGYRLFRYITLNENLLPFPFNDLPSELETPVEQIAFD